eukprot:scaffold15934_cov52-Cyclotella_meneghiniana.AAC.7
MRPNSTLFNSTSLHKSRELETDTKTSFADNTSNLDTTTKDSVNKSNLRGSKLDEESRPSDSGIDAYNNCEQECADNYAKYFNCFCRCPIPYTFVYFDDVYYDDFAYEDDYYEKSSFVAASKKA